MKISNERLMELVVDLIMSIDSNCYEFSEKLNIIRGSLITAEELKLLGFDYINTWLEDTNKDDEDYDFMCDDEEEE
jgi:hypothetical protein